MKINPLERSQKRSERTGLLLPKRSKSMLMISKVDIPATRTMPVCTVYPVRQRRSAVRHVQGLQLISAASVTNVMIIALTLQKRSVRADPGRHMSVTAVNSMVGAL